MHFEIDTEYLGQIELGKYEHVTVVLPDGRSITVFADMIYVATPEDRIKHKDGFKIWRATKGTYGTVSAQALS